MFWYHHDTILKAKWIINCRMNNCLQNGVMMILKHRLLTLIFTYLCFKKSLLIKTMYYGMLIWLITRTKMLRKKKIKSIVEENIIVSIIDRCATMVHNCLVKLRCKKSLEGMVFNADTCLWGYLFPLFRNKKFQMQRLKSFCQHTCN